jgi:hypothetical protein
MTTRSAGNGNAVGDILITQIGTFTVAGTLFSTPFNYIVMQFGLTGTVCVSCNGFDANVPKWGCINSAAPVSGTPGSGNWVTSNLTCIFASSTSSNTTMSCATIGIVSVKWSVGNCSSTKNITIIAPPVATFSPALLSVCGTLNGNLTLPVFLSGDASAGLWTGFEPGGVNNLNSAVTVFFWSASQVNSLCMHCVLLDVPENFHLLDWFDCKYLVYSKFGLCNSR